MNKDKYRRLCKTEDTISLFLKDWWLDAVCGEDNWDVILAENGIEIVGALPYHHKMQWGLNIITMPKLTQTMGVWVKYPNGQKYKHKISYENKIINEIICKLPSIHYFFCNLEPSITNWLPFYWKGFQSMTRYLYVIEGSKDLAMVFENFRSNIKTDIKKAQKRLVVYTSDDLELFYKIHSLTFKRQGLQPPWSLGLIRRVDDVCKGKKCRKIYFAKDTQNNIHSVLYVIWDENNMYALMDGSDPKLRNSGSMSLLFWEAIQFSLSKGKNFDFRGSVIETIEKYLRAFGGQQKPYFAIYKISWEYKLYNAFYRFINKLKRKLQIKTV